MTEFYLVVMANLPAIILILAGIVLVGVEIFIPGFGVPGIVGLICLVFGVILGADSPVIAVILIIGIILVLLLILFIAMRSASKGRIARTPLILKQTTSAQEGFSSTEDLSYLVGKEGSAATALRPAGIAQVEGERYDVVSEGEFIKPGEAIRVFSVEGRRVVVRRSQ